MTRLLLFSPSYPLHCTPTLQIQTFQRLCKWKKNEPNEDNYISSGRGDFWPPKNHLEITRELLLTSNWGSSSNLWFAPNQAYLAHNGLKPFLIEHYCSCIFFSWCIQLNKYETDPYILQIFQSNTLVCLIISVFCKSCEPMLCEPEIVQKICSWCQWA